MDESKEVICICYSCSIHGPAMEAKLVATVQPAAPTGREARPYWIHVRPWEASGGSSVHDEALRYEAHSPYEALMKLYSRNELGYDWKEWRVIDIHLEGDGARAALKTSEGGEG